MPFKLVSFAMVFIVSFGLSNKVVSQIVSSNKTELAETKTHDDKWKLDVSSGVPILIARETQYYGEKRVLAYLEPHYFNREDLGKVFAALSNRYKDSFALWIDVYSNKDIVADMITAESKGYSSWEKLPDSISRYKKDDENSRANKFFTSTYIRNIGEENYDFSSPNEEGYVKVVIREETKVEDTFETKLGDAAREGNLEEINRLLKIGVKVNSVNKRNATPLMNAAIWDKEEAVRLLLARGADVNLQLENNGQTALSLVCMTAGIEVVKMLIGAGADVNHKDKKGRTPLMEAAGTGDIKLVKYLLS